MTIVVVPKLGVIGSKLINIEKQLENSYQILIEKPPLQCILTNFPTWAVLLTKKCGKVYQ